MTIYFSPSTKGFFDTAIHGERQIEVVDTIAKAGALITADWQDDCDYEDARAKSDVDIDRASFTSNRQAVEMCPPMKMIDNPTCTLPADAVVITAVTYTALMRAQAEGKVIDVGTLGMPVAVDRVVDQMTAIRAARNAALKASDWTQLADAGLSAAKKKAWAAHRKHLRDLPALVAAAIAEGRDPAEIAFPEAPG